MKYYWIFIVSCIACMVIYKHFFPTMTPHAERHRRIDAAIQELIEQQALRASASEDHEESVNDDSPSLK